MRFRVTTVSGKEYLSDKVESVEEEWEQALKAEVVQNGVMYLNVGGKRMLFSMRNVETVTLLD